MASQTLTSVDIFCTGEVGTGQGIGGERVPRRLLSGASVDLLLPVKPWLAVVEFLFQRHDLKVRVGEGVSLQHKCEWSRSCVQGGSHHNSPVYGEGVR